LPKSCTNNAIIWNLWVQSVLYKKVPLNAIDFNMNSGSAWFLVQRNGKVNRTAGSTTKIFYGTQCSSCSATYIISTTLQAIKFFNNGERNYNIATGEGMKTTRVCNEN
jgi:hypothetical protein